MNPESRVEVHDGNSIDSYLKGEFLFGKRERMPGNGSLHSIINGHRNILDIKGITSPYC